MHGVLALDLGGTSFKAAAVTPAGEVLGYRSVPSAETSGAPAWLDAARALVGSVLDDVDLEARALGVSVPGAVDPAAGVLVDLVARLDAGRGVFLADEFAGFDLPVFADNDARAALAGERSFGDTTDSGNVVLLTLGTGLGGAAVVEGSAPGGEPVLAASQIGHFGVELNGAPCVCGNAGCAETIASATGVMRLAREAGIVANEASDVFARAREGDGSACRIVERFADALAAVIVTAIHAYQPDQVVLAGGLMGAREQFLPRVETIVTARAWTYPRRRVAIRASALGEHIGVLGAAAVAFAHLDPQQ